MGMASQFRFLSTAIRLNLRAMVEYRYELIGTCLTTFFKLGLFLATWLMFFHEYQDVHGWTFREMLLLSGLFNVSISTVEIFCYGLRQLPIMVDNGQLESFLLQPQNTILLCAFSRGKMANLAEVVSGTIFIGLSGYLWAMPLQIFAVIILGVLFSFSLLLYLACLAFFLHGGNELIQEIISAVRIVASQPSSALRGLLQFLSLFVVPIAFCSYFPIEALRQHSMGLLALTAVGTIVFFRFSCRTFYYCLRHYESGSHGPNL
ncbi:MAG: ABC-2 family transporter protein [Puniceicoccales bacterium]|jgi:ABC-2 type transport system permease protein|nr:ABC-2 family transporter protein [Puniceicoccales bacterium]